MGAILTATSIPGVYIPVVGFRFADKVVHVVMYGVLGFLVDRAIDPPTGAARVRAAFGTVLCCVALGGLDEWHQQFIPGRAAEIADWMADSAGGLVGAATWVLRSRHREARPA